MNGAGRSEPRRAQAVRKLVDLPRPVVGHGAEWPSSGRRRTKSAAGAASIAPFSSSSSTSAVSQDLSSVMFRLRMMHPMKPAPALVDEPQSPRPWVEDGSLVDGHDFQDAVLGEGEDAAVVGRTRESRQPGRTPWCDPRVDVPPPAGGSDQAASILVGIGLVEQRERQRRQQQAVRLSEYVVPTAVSTR